MTAVTDLQSMLQTMEPELIDEQYVFFVFPDGSYGDHAGLNPVAAVQEKEGLTLIVSRTSADRQGLAYDGVFRCISLSVHSALEVAGLVAAFSTALAEVGISANVIAGYYHDHIFVPETDAAMALETLQALSAETNA